MNKLFSVSLLALLVLTGCVTPKVHSVWKATPTSPYRYTNILVVAVIPGDNDSLQAVLEAQTVRELKAMGYPAVSYKDGFSVYGIAQETTQEAAYFTLCEKGIDGVLTLAMVDAEHSVQLKKGTMSKYPASYYFNHIWNYRALKTVPPAGGDVQPVWECILFDLRSLEQQSVLQVNNLSVLRKENQVTWIARNVTRKLVDERIIAATTGAPASQPKGF